jgi:AraC family transcriptional regulator of arabinose operon
MKVGVKNIVEHGARNGPEWCFWEAPVEASALFAPESLISEFFVTRCGYFPKCWQNAAWRPNPLGETVVSICLGGRGWVADMHNLDAPKIPVVTGDVMVVPPNAPHSYGADDKDPWTQLFFHVSGSRASRFLIELGATEQACKGRVSQVALVEQSIRRINELYRGGCRRNVLLESAVLGELVFARLYAEACLQPMWRSDAGRSDEKQAIEYVLKLNAIKVFFHENFGRTIVLAEVARQFSVSESWLCHAFKDHTGFGPLQFVINLRLQEACRLLARSDRKLEDIAMFVGYDDPFYFSRLFKRHLGLAPSAYRKQHDRRRWVG